MLRKASGLELRLLFKFLEVSEGKINIIGLKKTVCRWVKSLEKYKVFFSTKI
jgi:hypothetical protein